MNEKLYPYLKNSRIVLITATVVVLAFGLTDIVKKQTNTMEVVAMIVLLVNLIYLGFVTPKLPQHEQKPREITETKQS